MDITVNAPKAVAASGSSFQELYLGAETYTAVRAGQAVNVKCSDGDVAGSISEVSIGPLGQFLGSGYTSAQTLGRALDVRTVVDDLERRYPKKADNAIDPRTLYTRIVVTVPYAAPGAA